jgi:hypothetical protein
VTVASPFSACPSVWHGDKPVRERLARCQVTVISAGRRAKGLVKAVTMEVVAQLGRPAEPTGPQNVAGLSVANVDLVRRRRDSGLSVAGILITVITAFYFSAVEIAVVFGCWR